MRGRERGRGGGERILLPFRSRKVGSAWRERRRLMVERYLVVKSTCNPL